MNEVQTCHSRQSESERAREDCKVLGIGNLLIGGAAHMVLLSLSPYNTRSLVRI